MKKLFVSISLMLLAIVNLSAQKNKVTVLNIDTRGVNYDPYQMGSIVRTALDKLDLFEVMDKYDVNYVIDKNKLEITNCYGKLCLVEIGKVINADKMLTGSVELLGKSIIVTLKLIDVKSETVEKTTIMEFLELPEELPAMIMTTINTMFDKKNDAILLERLTKKNNFESTINTPNEPILKLNGPRMGFVMFTGQQYNQLRRSEAEGGYDAFPVMFQFGYQFEKQYLNEGNFQALFEFIPIITGLDQGKFFPSISILNGLRSNLNGWEFAFGPTFGFDQKADGYFDNGGKWHLQEEWTSTTPNTYSIVKRSDSRGDYYGNSYFVIAVGKTIKSGKMNIPINAFFIPTKSGMRFGVSFGYNAKRK